MKSKKIIYLVVGILVVAILIGVCWLVIAKSRNNNTIVDSEKNESSNNTQIQEENIQTENQSVKDVIQDIREGKFKIEGKGTLYEELKEKIEENKAENKVESGSILHELIKSKEEN